MLDYLHAFIENGGGIVSTTAIIGGFLWKSVQYINQQHTLREERTKKELEERAAKLKQETEEKAAIVKKAIEDKAEEVKNELCKENDRLMDAIDSIKVSVEDLKKRDDLTNGNVADIRNDIADLQEELQELYESTPHMAASDVVKNSRTKRLKRREKRKIIEANRIAQNHDK
jgi:hypothetical protein